MTKLFFSRRILYQYSLISFSSTKLFAFLQVEQTHSNMSIVIDVYCKNKWNQASFIGGFSSLKFIAINKSESFFLWRFKLNF